MNALLLSLAATSTVSLPSQEILLRDLPGLTGLNVELSPEIGNQILFVRVSSVEPKRFLELVATAIGGKLTPTTTGFSLTSAPAKPAEGGWSSWQKRVSSALGNKNLEQVRAGVRALVTQREQLLEAKPSGWQESASKLGNELGPLADLAQNALGYPILKLNLPTPLNETQVLRLPDSIRRELDADFSPGQPGEPSGAMVFAYRLEATGLRLALASVPRQGSLVVFDRILPLEVPPPLSTVSGPMDDPIRERKAKSRRFGGDGTVWLEQLPGDFVVWTARERCERAEPAKSAMELRSRLTSAGFELKFADGVWTGQSPRAREQILPMDRIRTIEARGGFATLDEFAELAAALPALNPNAISVDFDLPSLVRAKPALRAYASLTPDRRERLRERIPLAVDELNPAARQAFWNALRRDADPIVLARMAVTLDPARDLGEAGLSFHLSHFVSPVNVDFSAGGVKFLEQPNLNTRPARLRRCEFRFGYSVEESMVYSLDVLEPAN
jgi:hypothetical protein